MGEQEGDDQELARARSELAEAEQLLAAGDHEAALATARRAREDLVALGDGHRATRARLTIARAQQALGHLREALGGFLRAAEELDGAGDAEGGALARFDAGCTMAALGRHADAARTLDKAGAALHALGRHAEAHDAYRQAREECLAVGYRADAAIAWDCAGALDNVGTALGALGRHAEGLDAHRQAREEYLAVGDRAGAARALYNAGNALGELGRHPEGLDAHRQAREEYLAVGDRAGAASALSNAGVALRVLGRHAEALDTNRQAREERLATGDRAGAARALCNAGNILRALGRHSESLDVLRQAREEVLAVGARDVLASALGNAGATLDDVARHAESLHASRQAREEFLAVGDRAGAATALHNAGNALLAFGRDSEAAEAFEAARAEYADLGDGAGVANCDRPLRTAATNVEVAEARLAALGPALEAGVGDPPAARVVLDAAPVLRRLGRHDQAAGLLADARTVLEPLGLAEELAGLEAEAARTADAVADHAGAAAAWRAAAALFGSAGDTAAAADAWSGARGSANLAGDRAGAAEAGESLGRVWLGSGRMADAAWAFAEAARDHEAVGALGAAARCRIAQGRALVGVEDFEAALAAAGAGKAVFGERPDGPEASALAAVEGLAHAGLGDNDKAETALVEALEGIDDPVEVAICRLALAGVRTGTDAAQAREDAEEAAELFTAAGRPLDAALAGVAGAEADLAAGAADAALDAALVARDALGGRPLARARAEAVVARAHLGLAAGGGSAARRHTDAACRAALGVLATLDAHRYLLVSPAHRSSWSAASHAGAAAVVLGLAGDDHALVAEVVETARIQCLPATAGPPGVLWTSGLHQVQLRHPASHHDGAATMHDAGASSADAEAAALAQAGEAVPLASPPALAVGGTSRIAGATGLPRRRVALEEAAIACGGPGAIWWGTWVVGDALWWSLVGPALCASGSVPLAEVSPVLARLDAALPLHRAGETAAQALARAEAGALANPDAEADLAAALGAALVPGPLAERLEDPGVASVVVAPASQLGRVPFALLALGDGRRLGEAAVVRLGASAALVQAVAARPGASGAPGPDATVVAVLDPGGEKLFDHPPSLAATTVLSRLAHLEGLAAAGHTAALATPEELRGALEGADVWVYVGHADSTDTARPAASHLVLADGARLAARDWLYQPGHWPLPARVALVGCGTAGTDAPEWLGLAPAALWAGARVVLASAWNLPAASAKVLADDALRVLRDDPDPAAGWRRRQLAHLEAWRAGRGTSPLGWGALQVVGLAG